MTTGSELGLLRLVAQRIVGVGCTTAGEAVRWMGALQAQDYRGALASVALRTRNRTVDAVEGGLTAGEFVRSWPMRGTLHLVAAEDLGWMLELTAPRTLSSAAARQVRLGLQAQVLESARTVAVQVLQGGRRLRRRELFAEWEAAGLTTTGQRGYHLPWHLAQTATVCFGPVRGGEQLLVLAEEWIRHPRRLEREEALGEWAVRYFRSHGPATVRDFARWTNLLAVDVRTGVALARPQLASITVDNTEYLMDPRTPELLDACRRRAGGVFLLPGFDEFILGYQDRSAVLPEEFAGHIVPGGNGMFRPTVISRGRVVGTWKHTGSGAGRGVDATPFTTFTDPLATAIARAHAALP